MAIENSTNSSCYSSLSSVEKAIENKDVKAARKQLNELKENILNEEQKKSFNEQKKAYESEIKYIEERITENDNEIDKLGNIINDLKNVTFSNKFDIVTYGALISSVIFLLLNCVLYLLTVNLSPETFFSLVTVFPITGGLLSYFEIRKMKKIVKEKYGITNEKDIQNKMLDYEIKKNILYERNNIYNKVLNTLKEKYEKLLLDGKPISLEHKVNDKEEMNTNNIRSTKIINNNINDLRAKLLDCFLEVDKMTEKTTLKEANNKYRDTYGLLGAFTGVETFSKILFWFTIISAYASLSYGTPPILLFAGLGLSTIGAYLKSYGIKSRIKTIKRRLERLNILKFKYKELEEEKDKQLRDDFEKQVFLTEQELIKERIDYNYSERKKKEFDIKHPELCRDEVLEQTQEGQMVLRLG